MNRLGRGISALIPEDSDPEPGSIALIPVSQIRPNPGQPRKEFDPAAMKELEESIAQKGVVQPITVRKTGDDFELIVGERRWRASKAVGLEKMPAYVLEVESDVEMMEFALIENLQRQDLNPMELAHAYNALVEQHGLSQAEVGEQVGKSRSAIANFIRLLDLPSNIQHSLRDGEISAGHARALLSVEDEERQQELWRKITRDSLSVRQVERLVKQGEASDGTSRQKPQSQTASSRKSPYLTEIEERLQHRLGTKVSIQDKKDGGTIQIRYFSHEDLERLLELLESTEL